MFPRTPAPKEVPVFKGPPTFTTTTGHVERPAARAGNPSTTEDLTRQYDFKPGRRIVASDRDYGVDESGALRRANFPRMNRGKGRSTPTAEAQKAVATARIESALARRGEKRAKRKLRRALGEAKRLQETATRLLEEITADAPIDTSRFRGDVVASVVPEKWHHLATETKGGESRVYLNGEEVPRG